MDTEARLEQLLEAAITGRYVPERAVNYPSRNVSLIGLADHVKRSSFISSWSGRAAAYRLPSKTFWPQYVERCRRQLAILQRLPASEVNRLRFLHAISRHLLAMECLMEENSGDGLPLAILPSLPVGIKEVFRSDQVVVAWAGSSIRTINAELAQIGQCIPFPGDDSPGVLSKGEQGLTLCEAIGLNLPHGLEAQCGNWRDWILGMTVLLADGTIAKSGSRAVKNVAGYDGHKLFIGARGTLGIVLDVTVRTRPLATLPASEVVRPEATKGRFKRARQELWIQRTARSDFRSLLDAAGDRCLEHDPASSTLWAAVELHDSLPRFPGDWVLRGNCGDKNVEIADPTLAELMKRAKTIFDPTNKLNPGELGVV